MKRYPGLDVLRAIAIVWVLLFHGYFLGYGTPVVAVAKFGWMGVDLFFALSGYLIGSQLLKMYAQGETPSFAAFYRRRAFRILPAYLVVLALYFTIPVFRESPSIQPLWQFLTFTQNLYYDAAHSRAYSHSWSLCVEEHFYLFFPVLAWILMRSPSWKKTAAVCCGLLAAGIIYRAYAWVYIVNVAQGVGAVKSITGSTPVWQETIYYPTYTRLDGLMAGVCVAAVRWFRPAVWAKWMGSPHILLAVGVSCVAAALAFLTPFTGFRGSVFGYPLIAVGLALIVGASVSDKCVLSKLCFPGVQGIAVTAFSVYLIHKQAFHLVKVYFPALTNRSGLEQFLVYGGAGVGSGLLLYWLVERPFLIYRDRWDAPQMDKPVTVLAQPRTLATASAPGA
jgi:peptidoglycan/LPS O-acetylase OafA/YrhL